MSVKGLTIDISNLFINIKASVLRNMVLGEFNIRSLQCIIQPIMKPDSFIPGRLLQWF